MLKNIRSMTISYRMANFCGLIKDLDNIEKDDRRVKLCVGRRLIRTIVSIESLTFCLFFLGCHQPFFFLLIKNEADEEGELVAQMQQFILLNFPLNNKKNKRIQFIHYYAYITICNNCNDSYKQCSHCSRSYQCLCYRCKVTSNYMVELRSLPAEQCQIIFAQLNVRTTILS